jgi:hypothetical protein
MLHDKRKAPTQCIDVPDEKLRQHAVLVAADNVFQRRARLLQALWREAHGLPIGERRRGVPLGSRLPMPFASESGANLLGDVARAAARRELAAKRAGSGQHIEEERLWANLLSSQPLAFSMFAELEGDLGLATRVFARLWPERIATVTKVAFEYSPGRGSERFTADRTAFDVYVEHTTHAGGRGFVGIEVKYHEALGDAPAKHRARYDQVTTAMGCFKPSSVLSLCCKPIEQIWRDHMLAGSMLLDSPARWETGLYVFLYPRDNERCHAAVQRYGDCLSNDQTFTTVTLETMVEAIEAASPAPWIRDVRERYLGWWKLDAAV